MQIRIISRTNKPISLRDILLREVIGKWGITVLLPLMLGRIWLGTLWMPSVFDILMLVPIMLLCSIYFLATKQMWYEWLAGLSVERNLKLNKVKFGFYALLITAIIGITTGIAEYFIIGRLPCRLAAYQNNESTKPYVRFLEEQNTNPVDYVIGLFDKYDVVVLCERGHPEMKQYDFIHDILRDPRFISKVGHIYSEIGQVGMQDYVNKFMLTDSLSETEVHNRTIHIMRNVAVGVLWEKLNAYNYFTRLYYLNQKLTRENRIQHHFTDSELDWSPITTKNEYDEHKRKYIWNRDSIMAKTVIENMDHLSKTTKNQPKALVIMNYRHGMDLTDRLPNAKRKNTYEFIKDSFGNRSANVLINSSILLIKPVAGGVWNAAFEKTGNKPLGFDFQGSPFGSGFFDMYPYNTLSSMFDKSKIAVSPNNLRYTDVYTGFVFTHPTKDQYFMMNTPGLYDGFEDELIRRLACTGVEFEVKPDFKSDSNNASLFSGGGPFEFKVETGIELFLYFFAAIGLLIGLTSFLFRSKNTSNK